jgi:hypothetical protein
MKVAILIPFINDYIRDENDDPIYFSTRNEAMEYLVDQNCSAKDLSRFDYEEIEEWKKN